MGYGGKLATYGVLVGGAPRFRPDRGFPMRFAMDDGRGRVGVVVVHTWQNKKRWQKSKLVAKITTGGKIHRIKEKSRLAQEESRLSKYRDFRRRYRETPGPGDQGTASGRYDLCFP